MKSLLPPVELSTWLSLEFLQMLAGRHVALQKDISPLAVFWMTCLQWSKPLVCQYVDGDQMQRPFLNICQLRQCTVSLASTVSNLVDLEPGDHA